MIFGVLLRVPVSEVFFTEMQTKIVIIQPTPFCNIHCRYCYLPHRSSTKRISFETLTQIFKRLFLSPFVSDKVSIVWHAGEPLVLPIKFYEHAFQIIQQCNTNGIKVKNSFQTNGILITQEWCNFFKQHEVQIGVSLDGPEHIHDANRVDRAGKGTFERVMCGIKLLQENDIKFSIIAVVTKSSLAYAKEIWEFFMNIRPVHLGFNVEEVEGVNIDSSLEGTNEVREQYRKFLQQIFLLNGHSPNPLTLRESDSALYHIKYGSLHTRSHTNVPMSMLSFDYEGNISTFSPELLTMAHPNYTNFLFGNVFENTLEEVLTAPQFLEINRQIQRGVQRCSQTCDYFMFCGGGFPSNKICENGTFDSTETQACRLRIKVTTDVALEYLEHLHHIVAPKK